MNLVIGVDLDNTIICYDKLIKKLALQRALVSLKDKFTPEKLIAFRKKLLEDDKNFGDTQIELYQDRIMEAKIYAGVKIFFRYCKNNQIPVFIVSHKSKIYSLKGKGKGRRGYFQRAAFSFLKSNGFFDKNRIGLTGKHVFFEESRRNKIKRIKKLQCTHFIDDFEEIFLHRFFPKNTQKMLFSPIVKKTNNNFLVFQSWKQIKHYVQEVYS
ncbi:MAG: hypothetical protein HY843_03355 [Bdellovibrio sp.]|nr:hypothetical protein [Bdellovibrio sp.]